MKRKIITNWMLFLLIIISSSVFSQEGEIEKVAFVGRMAQKYKSPRAYVLTVGYVAAQDRDVYYEFSGGPEGFKVVETVPVTAGSGKFSIKLGGETLPASGKGYKIVVALRESKGGEKTTKSQIIINNIELVNDAVAFGNNASFSDTTPNRLDADSNIDFKINYLFKDECLVQVSVLDPSGTIVASSERLPVESGAGIKDINVVLPSSGVVGDNYRFVVNFGTANDFNTNNTVSEEIFGIKFTKKEVYSASELAKKSVEISLSKGNNELELPGDPIYQFIKIVDKSSKVVSEAFNTNKINVANLKPETYYIVTGSGYYFKFKKV